MTTTSPVSLEILEALEVVLPKSPKEIPADAGLSELEHVRAGWLALAHAEQIPDRLFEIGYWLGEAVNTLRSDDYRTFVQGEIEINVSIAHTSRNVPANAWNTRRKIHVFLAGNLVACWSWYYTSQAIDDLPADVQEGDPEELLYIPGDWTRVALNMYPKAEKTRAGVAMSANIAERNQLARQLLVGMSV